MSADQDFEEFAKKYPDLMAKSMQEYIGVGKGWHHILDTLFHKFSQPVESAKTTLKYALENPGQEYTRNITELEENLAKQLARLPVIVQIKEKFGGLRIYTKGVDFEFDAYTEFAEDMAYRTCELCGSPGKTRQTNWIKTLCEKHFQEQETGVDIFFEEREED